MNRPVSRLRALARSPLVWLALLGAVGLAVLVASALARLRHRQPPVLGTLPAFALTDQDGRRFGSRDLAGRAWVANFVFTTCPTICPLLTARMLELQRGFDRDRIDVRLVSFTIDPETDTPAVLRAFAARWGADPRRWRFLTGPPGEVRALLTAGFRLHVGERRPGEADIEHPATFLLVDAHRRLRGVYRSDDAGVAALAADARAVAGER